MSSGNYTASRPRKRGPKLTTLIFYGVYIAVILAFFCAMQPVLDALNEWLIDYEASQPKIKCQQVFDELFGDPDWAELYTMAGVEDTQFEGKEQFAAYMEQRVGDDALTYSETSAGLSGDKKYIVRHGNEKVATFTLTSEAHEDTDIADWELGTVEVFFTRTQSLTVHTLPGYTVRINGVPLDDSHIIRTVSTVAENYLPQGLHGYRATELSLDGLLVQPEVTVTSPEGEAMEVEYDPETGVYSHSIAIPEMTQTEYDTVLTAAKIYCRFMIRDVYEGTLMKYVDSTTELYKGLKETNPWVQHSRMKSFSFTPETISGFYRYSDDLYSARVEMTLQVTRTDNTIKEYPVATTFFLQKYPDGSWLVNNMTNVDIQEQQSLVRLTFVNGDEILSSEMTDAAVRTLTLPAVTAPEGQVFAGWFTETVDEDGSMTMSLVFAPDEDGTVTLPEDSELVPMTLYALFETPKTE